MIGSFLYSSQVRLAFDAQGIFVLAKGGEGGIVDPTPTEPPKAKTSKTCAGKAFLI